MVNEQETKTWLIQGNHCSIKSLVICLKTNDGPLIIDLK